MILYYYCSMIAFGLMHVHASNQVRDVPNVSEAINKALCRTRCGTIEGCLSSVLSYTNGIRDCSTDCKEVDGCWSSVCHCMVQAKSLLEIDYSIWSPGSEGEGGLELICRTETRLFIRWTTSNISKISYVIALYDLRHEELLDVHIGRSPVSYDNLSTGEEYKLHVFAVDDTGVIAFYTKTFRTLLANYQPEDVSEINVEKFVSNDQSVDAVIQWIPSAGRTCNYELVWWDEMDGINTEDVIVGTNLFRHTMKNLRLGLSYSVEISAKDSHWHKESNKTGITFNTPTCLELNKDKTTCQTFASLNLDVTDRSVGGGLYDLHVTWDQLEFKPDAYFFLFSGITENGISVNKTISASADAHEVYLRRVELMDWYSVRAKALYGENESPEFVVMHHKSSIIESEWRASSVLKSLMACGVVAILFFAMLAAFIRYRRRRAGFYTKSIKLQQTVQRIFQYPDHTNDRCANYPDPLEIDIGQLVFLEKLGQGAFGIVRKALLKHSDGTPDRLVAIKMLNSNPCMDDVRNFQEEIEVMRKVGSHPCIVSILGCSSLTSERMFFISEYCAKGDLLNYLRAIWNRSISNTCRPLPHEAIQNCFEVSLESKKIALDSTFNIDTSGNNTINSIISAYLDISKDGQDVVTNADEILNCIDNRAYGKISYKKESTITIIDLLNFGRQIAVGMEYLSSNKVVHRDLAARNILVCEDDSVKIADFGLSRDIYQQNVYKKTGDGKLPIKWMALESLTRQIYTTQSDVWSFGVLMWEIITLGAAPYPTTPARKLIEVLNSGIRMERPENCSLELYEILLSCWNARPYDRPTFKQLKASIEDLISKHSTQQYLTLSSDD